MTKPNENPVMSSGVVSRYSLKLCAWELPGCFVDFGTADSLVPFKGDYLELFDSNLKKIGGFIDTQCGSERLTGDILGIGGVYFGNMETDPRDYWTESSSDTLVEATIVHTLNQSLKSTGNSLTKTGGIFRNNSPGLLSGASLVFSAWAFSPTGSTSVPKLDVGDLDFDYNNYKGTLNFDSTKNIWLYKSIYFCGDEDYAIGVRGMTLNQIMYVDDCTLNLISSPGTTGVFIINSGVQYAKTMWEEKEAGFNYNDINGFTYKIYSSKNYRRLNINAFGKRVSLKFQNVNSASIIPNTLSIGKSRMNRRIGIKKLNVLGNRTSLKFGNSDAAKPFKMQYAEIGLSKNEPRNPIMLNPKGRRISMKFENNVSSESLRLEYLHTRVESFDE